MGLLYAISHYLIPINIWIHVCTALLGPQSIFSLPQWSPVLCLDLDFPILIPSGLLETHIFPMTHVLPSLISRVLCRAIVIDLQVIASTVWVLELGSWLLKTPWVLYALPQMVNAHDVIVCTAFLSLTFSSFMFWSITVWEWQISFNSSIALLQSTCRSSLARSASVWVPIWASCIWVSTSMSFQNHTGLTGIWCGWTVHHRFLLASSWGTVAWITWHPINVQRSIKVRKYF